MLSRGVIVETESVVDCYASNVHIVIESRYVASKKAVVEKIAAKGDTAAAAYAGKRAKVEAAVNKVLVERDNAEKAEFKKLINLSQQIDRAEKLVKLDREVRITSKDRKWKSFLKKL